MQISDRAISRNQEWRVVTITEVNPVNNHFAAKDSYGTHMLLTLMGGIIQEIPTVGETWTVSRQGSDWRLENRFEHPDTQLPITSMHPGDVRVEASGAISMYGTALKFNGKSLVEVGGTSTQTPGAVTVVHIPHGLGVIPTRFSAQPANINARGASAFYLSADGTNVDLTFASALTVATSYSWVWSAGI